MEKNYTNDKNELTFEKTWLMFQETDRRFKETDRKIQESDRKIQESDKKFNEKLERMSKETDRKIQETDRKFNEKLERMSKETNNHLNKISGLFSSQWGKLMEAIVAPSCLKLFRARNIDVTRTYKNIEIEKNNHPEAEFDIVLANGKEVVIVEVKTTMTVKKVNEFITKMNRITELLPEHKNKNIYGAIAGIKYEEKSDKYAYRKGLFVLINSGDRIIKIANNDAFVPVKFN